METILDQASEIAGAVVLFGIPALFGWAIAETQSQYNRFKAWKRARIWAKTAQKAV